MCTKEVSQGIAARIGAGELPSAVLRSVLDNSPDLTKYDLGPILVEAYDNFDLIYLVWNWREEKKSDARDTQFNIWVVERLAGLGFLLPFGKDYCEAEGKRIASALAEEAAAEQQAAVDAVSYENLALKIKQLEGKPACIQALWDGDTTGWFVCLAVIMNVDGQLREIHLGQVTLGTDIRLFNGAVPPWPEAKYAVEVGDRLADEFGAEFYFPAPDEPDDQCISWLELSASHKGSDSDKSPVQKRPWWRIW